GVGAVGAAEDGLARAGEARGADHEVHVERADDADAHGTDLRRGKRRVGPEVRRYPKSRPGGPTYPNSPEFRLTRRVGPEVRPTQTARSSDLPEESARRSDVPGRSDNLDYFEHFHAARGVDADDISDAGLEECLAHGGV